jgi:anti-sigma factor RsiW
MSTDQQDQDLQEKLSVLLDFNVPAVLIEEVRLHEADSPVRTKPMSPRRRGLFPAIAWGVGVLVLVALGVGFFVGVHRTTTFTGPAPIGAAPKLSDRLVLDKTRVVAGKYVKATIVVSNPGKTFDVETVCQPQIAVQLHKGSLYQQIYSPLIGCAGNPLIVRHGTTRIPVGVFTTYGNCANVPPYIKTIPHCLSNNRIPPLPAGTYKTLVLWGGRTSLPKPKAVDLTLTK